GTEKFALDEGEVGHNASGTAVERCPRAHRCPPGSSLGQKRGLSYGIGRPSRGGNVSASSAGLRRHTSTAVTASTRVTLSISLTSTQASSSSALPRIVAGPYSRHGMPAFQRWHVSSALYECGSTVPMAFGS